MSQEPLLQLTLDLQSDANLAPDEQFMLANRLQQELADTYVDSVELGPGMDAPPSSKGTDPGTAQLLVTLAVGLVPTVLLLIQNFLLRQKDQTLRVKIKEVELEIPRHADAAEIERLVKMVEKLAKKVR